MTEQIPAVSAGESTPLSQSSLEGQDTSRDRGEAGRGSRGRGRGRGGGRRDQQTRKNHNNERSFQGESEVKEFKHVTLIENGGPKQVQDIRTACKNYANTKTMPKMYVQMDYHCTLLIKKD